MHRRTKYSAIITSIVLVGLAAHFLLNSRVGLIRLQLLVRGHPFARIEPARAGSPDVPHTISSELIYLGDTCVGFVVPDGLVICHKEGSEGFQIFAILEASLLFVEFASLILLPVVIGFACHRNSPGRGFALYTS